MITTKKTAVEFLRKIFRNTPAKKIMAEKYIHFIWMGKDIPVSRFKNIVDGAVKNKDLKVIFWTDNIGKTLPGFLINEFNSVNDKYKIEIIKNNTQIEKLGINIKSNIPQEKIEITVSNISDFINSNDSDLFSKDVLEIIQYEATILDAPHGYGAASDVLRYYLLWKIGGAYYDSDDIPPENISQIVENFKNYSLSDELAKLGLQLVDSGNSVMVGEKNSEALKDILNAVIKSYSTISEENRNSCIEKLYTSSFIIPERCFRTMYKTGPWVLFLNINIRDGDCDVRYTPIINEKLRIETKSDQDWLYGGRTEKSEKKMKVTLNNIMNNLLKKLN